MMDATLAGVAILALVTLQRLSELSLASRNSRRLLAQGAVEHGSNHYPLVVALHALWLAALWWWAPGRPISVLFLTLFAVLQLGRVWVIATLGARWTTRIIVKPGSGLVRTGPYRYFNHPNYMIVTAEIAILPLVFGLWKAALIFSLLNLIMLTIRITAENDALASLRG
jgi:methyltransferase